MKQYKLPQVGICDRAKTAMQTQSRQDLEMEEAAIRKRWVQPVSILLLPLFTYHGIPWKV